MARLVPSEYSKLSQDSRLWPSVFEGTEEECEQEIKRIREAKVKEYNDTINHFKELRPDMGEYQIATLLGLEYPLHEGYFIVI